MSHRIRDEQQFPSKIATFFTPHIFSVPAERVPLGIWYRRKVTQKLKWLATRWWTKFSDKFSRLDTIPAVTDRQTDTLPYWRPR